MSFDIEGWVEISKLSPEDPGQEYAWSGVIRIGPFVDVPDEVSEQVFGLSKRCVSGKLKPDAIAAGRGLPPNPSQEVRRDMDWIAKHERQFGSGEIGGYTYATWAEAKTVLTRTNGLAGEWGLLFEIIARIEEDPRFTAERIRLVVWYVW